VDRSKMLGMVTVLASVSLIAGCFASNPEDIQAFVKPYEVNVTAENYTVQPPDEIEIHCTQVAEVHMQRQRVRPDGRVSFEVIGEVDVAGKTAKEISDTISERVKELYQLPGDHAVDVRIAVFASKNYYVVGQVMRPGPRVYTGRDSVLAALAFAQPNTMAWEARVQVIRPAAREDEEPRIFEFNYDKAVSHGDTTKDVLLEEGDIVYVPPTILAAIGMVLEEFISPVARAFYGAYLISNPPGTYEGGYSPYSGRY
jgi:polysaccharide export outer membrane protein